jgi:hypothetical protein
VHLAKGKEIEATCSPVGQRVNTEEHVGKLEEGRLGQVVEVFENTGGAHQTGQFEEARQQEGGCGALR